MFCLLLGCVRKVYFRRRSIVFTFRFREASARNVVLLVCVDMFVVVVV